MDTVNYNIPSNNRELQRSAELISKHRNYNIPSNNRELQLIFQMDLNLLYYNIPSNNRELQLLHATTNMTGNYNIPSNNRELQLKRTGLKRAIDYNIPSNNRELQQVFFVEFKNQIITYQVITGNYSTRLPMSHQCPIITYQVITGNYSYNVLWESSDNILKKYKWKRKSLAITPSDVNIFSQTSETLNGTAFKNIISCAKAAHDRHSPFAECINAFFSLALIISQSQKNNTLNKRDHI